MSVAVLANARRLVMNGEGEERKEKEEAQCLKNACWPTKCASGCSQSTCMRKLVAIEHLEHSLATFRLVYLDITVAGDA
jgi:hypothetical protein